MGVPEWQEKFKVHPKKLRLMLTEILTAAPIVAFTVVFWWASTWEGMINEWVRDLTADWSPYIKKPLYDCPICAAPWIGSLVLLGFGLFTGFWFHWFEWIIVVFTAGGINTVVAYVVSSDKEIVKELKDGE